MIMKQFRKKNKGFTLIELLVVIFIIGILSAITFPYYQSARGQLALQRAASKLAQDIRRVQEMAMSAQEINGEIPLRGYGIYLKKVPPNQDHTSYILFANKEDGAEDYFYYNQGEDEEIEPSIDLETGVKIKDIDFPHLNIVFIPPDPRVFIGKEDEEIDSASIIICLKNDETKSKTVTVNKAGLITIE